jgi:hypothetical protein
MESTRRLRIRFFGIFPVISALFLGICLSACTRTPEGSPSKPQSKAESSANAVADDMPAAKEQLKESIPPTEELEKKQSEEMQSQPEAKLPDEEEIRKYQEEEQQRRREEEKKYWASLGEPVVDNPEDLKRVDKVFPVWIDSKNKQVVMIGTVCQTAAPLEMFACLRGTKEHEAVLSVPTKAQVVHASLLAVGANPGHPVQFGPEGQYTPPTGTKIQITVRWKDAQGKVQTDRAQDWIKDMKTGKPLKTDWVFGGSGFYRDEGTGKEFYKAEGGDFICVSNFPSAMLDLPIESTDVNKDLLFQANPARIPPTGTPVTVILSPERKTAEKSGEKKDEG